MIAHPDDANTSRQMALQLERRQMLETFHRSVQRNALFIAGPALLLIFGISWTHTPDVINTILVFLGIFSIGFWTVGHVKQNWSLDTRVSLLVVPILASCFVELSLVTGGEISSILTMATACMYIAIFSRRLTIIVAITVAGIIITTETLKYLVSSNIFPQWPLKYAEGQERLIQQIGFSGVVILLMVFLLKKIHNINLDLQTAIVKRNETDKTLLDTLRNIQPIVKTASNRIRAVSNKVASQAIDHATAVSQLNAVMTQIAHAATTASQSANRVFDLSKTLNSSATHGASQLKTLEHNLNKSSESIQRTTERLLSLSRLADGIEEVLEYNKVIADNIKVLAVNASIEAADAGEYGLGFGVVAQELRELIENTQNNLKRSAQNLIAIRKEADQSSKEITEDAASLRQQNKQMARIAKEIDQIAESFAATTQDIGSIATLATQQGDGIVSISQSIEHLSNGAGDLKTHSNDLLKTVDHINASYDKIHAILTA